jgi:integrase
VWRYVKLGEVAKRQLSLSDAFIRYYDEVGERTRYGREAQRYHQAAMLNIMGRGLLLSDLTDAPVGDLVQGLLNRVDEHGNPDHLSPSTVNRHLTTLSAVCRRARETWEVEVGGWSMKKHMLKEPEGRESFLDHDQARTFLEELPGHAQPIVLLALLTGMRKGNVLDLEWGHISLDMGRAVMLQKGDRRLVVTLVPEAVALLERVQPDPTERVGRVWTFGNPALGCKCPRCTTKLFAGEPIKSIRTAFRTAIKAAGLTDLPGGKLRFHDLRHTAASWVLAFGGDLRMVQEMLGHKNIQTTARYTHLLPGRKESVMAQASAALFEAPKKARREAS